MLIAFFLGTVFIIALDQFSKYYAVAHLMQVGTVPVLKNIFHFTYVENTGASFGILSDKTWFLSGLTVVICVVLIAYVMIKRPKQAIEITALTFLLGGAIGNLIDRIRLGYVVDFLDFCWIDFPVFNVADCFVTVGTALLFLAILFSPDEKQKCGGEKAEKGVQPKKKTSR